MSHSYLLDDRLSLAARGLLFIMLCDAPPCDETLERFWGVDGDTPLPPEHPNLKALEELERYGYVLEVGEDDFMFYAEPVTSITA